MQWHPWSLFSLFKYLSKIKFLFDVTFEPFFLKIQLFHSRTNISQKRDANCISFTCLTKGPHGAILFCLAGLVAGLWPAKQIFGGRCRVEPRPDFGVYSSMHVKRCVVTPNGGPRSMDKPCQSDSIAGYVEGQIAGIAFGLVGAPLYKHERRDQKQQPFFLYMYYCRFTQM